MNQLGWLIHRDLVCEFRSRRAWPTMLLVGVVVALVFSLQIDVLPHQKQKLVGGLLWLAIFFAGTTAIDRAWSGEREGGCWMNLKLYPLSPALVFLAKLLVGVLALAVLQCLLIPLFFALSNVPLGARPAHLALVALLGNVGLAAVGTLTGALAASLGRSGSLLVLLALPLVLPVLLAAAEATRLLVEGNIDAVWWRWVQLLAAFAAAFVVAGALLFEFALED
jgi:heme exporter protein B